VRYRGAVHRTYRSKTMSIGAILLVVLILILIGVFPAWPYSTGWGYTPSGIVGGLLVVLLVALALGKI
jgi:hypothetical protein